MTSKKRMLCLLALLLIISAPLAAAEELAAEPVPGEPAAVLSETVEAAPAEIVQSELADPIISEVTLSLGDDEPALIPEAAESEAAPAEDAAKDAEVAAKDAADGTEGAEDAAKDAEESAEKASADADAEGATEANSEDICEEAADPEAADAADADRYYFNCPDVCDLRDCLKPSQRVYPGILVWPLKGQAPLSHLTSHVGWRNAGRIHDAQGGTWPSWLHHGIDVGGVDQSQLVVSASAGLAYAGRSGGEGNYVVIDHGNGWYTKYQHLSRFAGRISMGCRAVAVGYGDPIGYVGNSGGDYPVHFHFEIAWSPDGPGSDDVDFHRETHNLHIRAYSFPQESVVTLHWAERWEICTAECQQFVGSLDELFSAPTSSRLLPMGQALIATSEQVAPLPVEQILSLPE